MNYKKAMENVLTHDWVVTNVVSKTWDSNVHSEIHSKCRKCGLEGSRDKYLDKRYEESRKKGPHAAVPELIYNIKSGIIPTCEEMLIKDIIE